MAVAACSNDDGASVQNRQNAAERTPLLPGASVAGVRADSQHALPLAQGFDTPQPGAAVGASAPRPLLPPVFHTAD
ncbi:hypothetical protein [Trinickia mobilis]|uniref:hypothetical protein n=1 Tax=Trinickia mobilis TaxID=2816356 RepID=UPI001A8F58AF|nr:hypothetical protein [Trinickia mobilis]